MSIISPSILSADFLNFKDEFNELNKIENIWVHLDIMDGHFVRNMTFGIPFIKKFCSISKNPLDAHFMVTNPSFYLEELKDEKIHNFTFHVETTDNPVEFAKKVKKNFNSVGVSLRPSTNVSSITDELLQEIDILLIMSVEPGFGGQSFIESTWERINYFNSLKSKFEFEIQIDGGVSNKNIKELEKHGATNFVAGSFLFKEGSKNLKKQIQILKL